MFCNRNRHSLQATKNSIKRRPSVRGVIISRVAEETVGGICDNTYRRICSLLEASPVKGPLDEPAVAAGATWAPCGRPYIPSTAICRSWAAERSAHCERTLMPALALDGGGTGLSWTGPAPARRRGGLRRRWDGLRPNRFGCRGRRRGRLSGGLWSGIGGLLARASRRRRGGSAAGSDWQQRRRHARQDRPRGLGIHDAHRRDRRCRGEIDIDTDLARALRDRGGLGRRRIGKRAIGRFGPERQIMLQVMIERLCAQVRAHPARIMQERKRLAILARTTVACREHVGEETEAVGLERAAQRQQHVVDISAAASGVRNNAPKAAQAVPRRRTRRSPRLRAKRRAPSRTPPPRSRPPQRRGRQAASPAQALARSVPARAVREPGARHRGRAIAARSRKAHVIAAPRTAPRITKPARSTGFAPIPDWGRNNASTQQTRSNAADPAATHNRNAELPISGSTPNINPLRSLKECNSTKKYGPAGPETPALRIRGGLGQRRTRSLLTYPSNGPSRQLGAAA